MKIYLAGPMSGIPQFNYPAFIAAAANIRGAGHEVLCPAEMDSEVMQEACLASETGNFADLGETGETWGDLLAEDVKLIADEVDAVAVLPGWAESRGARLEVYVALTVQKPVYTVLRMGRLSQLDPNALMYSISACTVNQGDVSRYGTDG